MLGGRALGKTVALAMKAIILALLNPGKRLGSEWLHCYGAVCGRTAREVSQKILPEIFRLCADIKNELGIQLLANNPWNKQDQILYFANGAAVYLLSYGRRDALELIRGYTLGWFLGDEIEHIHNISSDDILKVAVPAIRCPLAKHKCFCWVSSPNGLRGMPLKHHKAYQEGDANWRLVHGTIFDNPFLNEENIRAIRSSMSKRQWQQEGLGVCLQALNVVFSEYSEDTHLIDYRFKPNLRTLVFIDWGTNDAYIMGVQVDGEGNWYICAENRVQDTTRLRFRNIVERFVSNLESKLNNPIYGFACDRAVKEERLWLQAKYSSSAVGGVHWLTSKDEQNIQKGLGLISSKLDPVDREPSLFVSSILSSNQDERTMGIRGAFQKYQYAMVRSPEGLLLPTDQPSKLNGADHPIDALRYGIVAFAHDPNLHGYRSLEYFEH